MLPRNTRHQVTRQRVEDWLTERGGGRGRGRDSRLEAQRRFVKRAIALGKEKGVRTFSEKSVLPEQIGLQSLQYLLEEKVLDYKGVKNTGGGSAWVLDLWDLVLAERDGCRLTKPVLVPVARSESPKPGVAVFQEEAIPQVVILPQKDPSWGMRLIEAYLNRDDDTIMRLAMQVSGREGE